MSLRMLLVAAAVCAASCEPAYAGIAYPVDVAATSGAWTIWDTQTNAPFRRGVSWPVMGGGPVPGLDPRYAYLLTVRQEPPEIDTRLQEIAYPCPEVADLAAATLTQTCTATVRPAADLIGATRGVAQERIQSALERLGLANPADQYRAIALLSARGQGQALSAEQTAFLGALQSSGIEYVDQVRAAEVAIATWITAHPGQIPDLGEAVWPPLPPLPAGAQ